MKKIVPVVLAVSVGLVAISPAIASAVATTANTTINATVATAISMTTSGTVALAVTPTSSGTASSASDAVSVSTNDALGYNLSLATSTATTTLTNGGNTIAGSAGTFAAPAALATNTWGYRVDGAGTFGAGPTSAQTNAASLTGTWAAVPASGSPQQLKTTSATANNDITTVWYGVKTDLSKASGVYSNTVTYTATGN
jgi:hypothetical protein